VRFVSSRDGSNLLEAEVGWPAVPGSVRYILRWEAGQLLSVLLTNETTAFIPILNPAASLQVEVALLDSDRISAPLIIAPPPLDINTPAVNVTAEKNRSSSSVSWSTATKVTLIVSLGALTILLVSLSVLVGVLMRLRVRGHLLTAGGDLTYLDVSSRPSRLLKFDKFLEKNRLSHIDLTMM
jgi:hypothetical protein